MHSSKASINNR